MTSDFVVVDAVTGIVMVDPGSVIVEVLVIVVVEVVDRVVVMIDTGSVVVVVLVIVTVISIVSVGVMVLVISQRSGV